MTPVLDADERSILLDELRRIHAASESGKLLAADVVDAARDPENPLHEFFQWNDTEAAERWRHLQARTLIHRFWVVPAKKKQPNRIYFSLMGDRVNGGGYHSYQQIERSPALQTSGRETAVGELWQWVRRNRMLYPKLVRDVEALLIKSGHEMEE